jgi:multiple sugar transport system ATP-binding protein
MPSVFLFDEPLSNLDAKLRVQTRAQLTKLHAAPRHHLHLCDARPDGSHDHGEPHRRHEGWLAAADRRSASVSTTTRHNVFVAGFIGSPSMNFFDATLVESDGKLEINSGGFRLPVPQPKADEWRPHKGKQVIFGIRPEDIHAKPFVPPSILEADMSAKVDVVEMMGNEIFLYLMSRDNKQFIGRVDPRVRAQVGDEIQLAVNMANAHIFDPKTEISLAG